MQRSTNGILVTHAGSLPRPADLWEMVNAKSSGKDHDPAMLEKRLREGVQEVVQKQVDTGVAVVNDGEYGKPSWNAYVRERLTGYEERLIPSDQIPRIFGRDLMEFPEYFDPQIGTPAVQRRFVGEPQMRSFCVEPLKYVGHDAVKRDTENFKAALKNVPAADAFLPAVTPGALEHNLHNEYYPDDEAFLKAIADVMREEYKAIIEADFLLQLDDPGLPDGWQFHPEMTVPEYRKFAELRVEALNYALRDIPEEKVRLHTCWGSYHGPHKHDLPLKDIVDIILKTNVQAYSLEASNPCHEHEWEVWKEQKLPDGKILIPGMVGHASDFVEHPELVAQRIVRFAGLVGRENVIAGTDCGLGTRVGHAKICWSKLESLAEGARLASQRLWG